MLTSIILIKEKDSFCKSFKRTLPKAFCYPIKSKNSSPMGPSLSGKMGLYHNRLTASKSHIIGNELLSLFQFSSVQSLSRVQLCDPMNRSMPGLPVHHQLPEFTQTHVHRVCDAIQPSHPLLSPSPPAPNPSQHQSLFQ